MPGVFETFRSYTGGSLWRFNDHWQRWQESAAHCGFVLPMEKQLVAAKLAGVLSQAGEGDLRLRLWSDGQKWRLESDFLRIESTKAGVEIIDTAFQREMPQAKHDQHDYSSFFVRAAECQAFDVIWFDQSEQLREGNMTNVFMVKDGQIYTPKVDKILPGLMRQWILENFSVIERSISREELLVADEIFLTNMVRGIISVRKWGDWARDSFSTGQQVRQQLELDQKSNSVALKL